MVNVLLAILVLSIIVIIHEFGHYIVAKANGVTVVEFCIGFGPKLIHFKKGDTEYSIKLLPFGGACVMLGDNFMEVENMDDDDDDEEDDEVASSVKNDSSNQEHSVSKERMKEKTKTLENNYDMSKSFENQSVWARIAIIAAGPIFNFILAFILGIVILGYFGYDPCLVDKIYDNSPATVAGLQEGDRIVKVNGKNITFDREFSFYRNYHAADTMHLTYVRDGEKYETTLVPEYQTSNAYKVGIRITPDNIVDSVNVQSPAEKGGLKANDIIKTVNGEALMGGKLSEYISNTQGEELTIVVDRNGNDVTLKIKPEIVETSAYYVGFDDYGLRYKTSPLKTVGYAFQEVGFEIKAVIESIGMMFTGKLSINSLMGPVGTVSVMSSVVEQSKSGGALLVLMNMFNLGLIISANLGMMNLLPIPALDGGRLVFLLIEAVRGKPVKREHEGMVHFVGMILLILLMVYILFKDIVGLF